MRDWRVRAKLAAVLTIPLIGFLFVAGAQITTSVRTASDLDAFAEQVAVGREVTALVHELQRERDRTTGVLAEVGASAADGAPMRDVAGLAPEWTAVDRAVERLRAASGPLLRDAGLAQAYRHAEQQLSELSRVRQGATDGWLRRQAAFDIYTTIITSLHALLPRPIDVGGDASLGRVIRGFTSLAHAKELTARIRGLLYIVCSAGGFRPGDLERIAAVRAETQSSTGQFRADAAAAQLAVFDDTVTGQAVRNAKRLQQTVIDNAQAAELGVEPQQWWLASTTELELIRKVEQQLLTVAAAGVAAANKDQWQTTLLGSLATAALLMVAVVTSVIVGRGMARTLRSLREQALEVAQERLPSVIEQLRLSPTKAPPLRVDRLIVNTSDEIGEVAEAFTAVHRSAVRLAAEQAHMRRNVNEIFIKLARRSQTLVERQLQLLDTMESAEADPDQLANLFQIDHLATRLRRNDENLLVLAGGDSTRRWNQPVELNTVVVAATAEIEQYDRIQPDLSDHVHVVGYVVTDLIHLVAELLENATTFSPPSSTVTVEGRALPDGGAELTLRDSGIGMSPEALAEANQQLAQPVSIDISAAERMGLVVVGHLAKRHGIGVRLSAADPGVTVHIDLPGNLIAPAPPEPPPTIESVRYLRADGTESVTSANGDSAAPTITRRPARPRAEDVLGPGRSISPSVWWSRDAAAIKRDPAESVATVPRQPQVASTTDAGLPKRVRGTKRSATTTVMVEAAVAQAPVETMSTTVTVDTASPDTGAREAEQPAAAVVPNFGFVDDVPAADPATPEETGRMLSALYSGVRRANAEVED